MNQLTIRYEGMAGLVMEGAVINGVQAAEAIGSGDVLGGSGTSFPITNAVGEYGADVVICVGVIGVVRGGIQGAEAIGSGDVLGGSGTSFPITNAVGEYAADVVICVVGEYGAEAIIGIVGGEYGAELVKEAGYVIVAGGGAVEGVVDKDCISFETCESAAIDEVKDVGVATGLSAIAGAIVPLL